MLLGTKNHTAGNTTIYAVDYSNWLDDGVTLSTAALACTAAIDPATPVADVTITAVTVTPSQHILFTVVGGSLNETFTVDVKATDSRGEVKNDTARFNVVAP